MLPLHSYDENDLHFHAIDEHAKRATDSDASTYQSLVSYLSKPLSGNINKDLLLARALVVWLCHVQSRDLSRAAFDTPSGLVQQLKVKNIEYSRVFKMLCGYAGIECEIIQGRAKAIRYKAGDGDSSYIQGHTWNAFKAGGQWHLIHPQWCVHIYVGFVHGGENVLERDGKHEFTQTVQTDGVSKFVLNDFWFCTNPDIYVTRCLPNDPTWQLLPNNKSVQSVTAFLSLPDLRQGFYRSHMTLLQPNSCTLQVKNGKCEVNILVPRHERSRLQFSYKLLATHVNNLDTSVIPLLVLFIPNNPPDTFNFEISFPAIGLYRLEIRCGEKGQHNNLMKCCEFQFDCETADPNCRKLPVDAGIQGWGFGPDAANSGLKRPSISGAKIALQSVNKVQKGKLVPLVEFKVDADDVNDKEYSADIYKSSDSPEKAKAAMGKAIKQAQNQAKMTKALEKNSILKTEKDKLQDDMDELLKRIADNEPCD